MLKIHCVSHCSLLVFSQLYILSSTHNLKNNFILTIFKYNQSAFPVIVQMYDIVCYTMRQLPNYYGNQVKLHTWKVWPQLNLDNCDDICIHRHIHMQTEAKDGIMGFRKIFRLKTTIFYELNITFSCVFNSFVQSYYCISLKDE